MSSSSEKVNVAVAALRSDTTKWTTASDEMGSAARTAQNVVLGVDQFGWVAEQHGIVAAYTALQEKLAHLLTGASTEFNKIAVALRASADTYEREDAEGAHTMNKIMG